MRFLCAARVVSTEAGASVFRPKKFVHAFGVEGSNQARLLHFASPGGFD